MGRKVLKESEAPMDHRYAAEVVAGDLEVLEETLRPDLSEARLRQVSAVLRRLLVEGAYVDAWRRSRLAGEPSVDAPDLLAAVSAVDSDALVLASAGPIYRDSQRIPGIVIGRGDTDSLGAQKSAAEVMRRWRVTSYLSQPCMLIQPVDGRLSSRLTPVPRESLIKWVANKLGGVHMDAKRLGNEVFYALSWSWDSIDLDGKGAHMQELLACAQALATSSDSQLFRERVGRSR